MKLYESYTIADFIQDDDFRDWVRGNRSRDSFWSAFLEQYPEKQEAFRQAEQFVRAAAVAPERISEGEIRREVERFIETAGLYGSHNQPVVQEPQQKTPRWRMQKSYRWGVAVAAVLAVVAGIGWWSLSADNYRPNRLLPALADAAVAAPELVETINPTKQPLRVVLNDGSEVVLSPQSKLRYPAQFAENARIVYLTGEGAFSVKRQHRPFMVYTGETVTKVLGTRFVVRAFDRDHNITVQVLSGKVQVYKAQAEPLPGKKEKNSLILNANQAAIFEKSDGNLTKTLVANPMVVANISRTESLFVYDETPLPGILRELEQRYGIPIQFDEQSFEGCKITASLTNETLYEKLDLLCKAASATYEITDGQIVINRKN